MASIMNGLNIGYSGLNAAQVGINVTGQNISNAETEGYNRQRVVTSAATPFYTDAGNIGNGVEVENVARVFDNFVYDRYTSVSSDKSYSDYEMDTLNELSTYFPEIDNVGIKHDLANYYDMWQTFSDNPDNDAIKTALTQQAKTLTASIRSTQDQIAGLQMKVNDQIEVDINQVNELGQQLADLNLQIDTAEAGDKYIASDLRDKRDLLEKQLGDLIGAKVTQGQIQSDIGIDKDANIRTGSYTLSVNGYNLVDGATYHPIKITKEENSQGFYQLSYERQDGVLIPLEESINGGRIGAALDLRGGAIDTTTGMPTDGIIQTTLSDLDAFAKGLIESTNNLYAQSATDKMESNDLTMKSDTPLIDSGYNINQGAFDVVMYDIDGNEISRRKINIDNTTTMSGTAGSNSIEGQMKANNDDNGDNNGTNDIDDFLTFSYQTSADGRNLVEFGLNEDAKANGYTFSIEDNLTDDAFASGTNFAGALGLGRFFDGNGAKDINLNYSLRENPTNIHGGYSSVEGDNRVALDMVQQQYENFTFKVDNTQYNTTLYGMFDNTATYVGVKTNTAIGRNDTISAQYNATEMEYFSTSKVSIDEEMTNLIKYQTAYSASAKVITTVDQMMKTLLGIKT
jgi:flagellar hook-associated protein 1 FlgK